MDYHEKGPVALVDRTSSVVPKTDINRNNAPTVVLWHDR